MKPLLLMTLLAASCSSVYAGSANENALLAKLATELGNLTPLINQAQQQADKTARVQFNYPALRRDLRQMIAGINQKLGQVQIQPRVVTPIHGDYVQLKAVITKGKHA